MAMAAAPAIPPKGPEPQKRPEAAVPARKCLRAPNAVTERKPWLSSAECAAKTVQPPGGACNWANECTFGFCVVGPSGAGVCAAGLEETQSCVQAMGPGNATMSWVGGLANFACAGEPGSDLVKLCMSLPKNTPKPACANNSLTGHSCQVDQACTTNEMCQEHLSCVRAYPNPVGKCAARANNACPGGHSVGTLSATDPASLCVPNDLLCR